MGESEWRLEGDVIVLITGKWEIYFFARLALADS